MRASSVVANGSLLLEHDILIRLYALLTSVVLCRRFAGAEKRTSGLS
jgi:hypothetical protein